MKKYLFLDRGIFNGRYMTNAKVELASIQKEGAVFFREDFFADPPRKWEVRYDNGYPNVLYDSKEKIYRCYYTLFIHDRDSENTPLKERAAKTYVPGSDRVTALRYACSTDGIHWEKPELGLVDFKGNKRNNILYAYVHGTGVFLDEEELDPKRRYKLVTKVDYAPGCGYMAVGFSADGIHFGELKKWTGGQPRADTHNFVFREERTGRFVLITRIWKNGQRIAARCESSDFLNWTEPQEIFRGRGFEDQIYSMPVFRYNDIYLGVPSVYHEGDTADKDYDTVDLRLAWSVDTLDWEEVAFGENFMDREREPILMVNLTADVSIPARRFPSVTGSIFIIWEGTGGIRTTAKHPSPEDISQKTVSRITGRRIPCGRLCFLPIPSFSGAAD